MLPFRKDKAGLRRLLEKEPAYKKMDEETAKTVSVLMGVKAFMENRERYKEGAGYNMCQAIREMMEDSRLEGEKAGRMEKRAEYWEAIKSNTEYFFELRSKKIKKFQPFQSLVSI